MIRPILKYGDAVLHDRANIVDTNDAWIRDRVGIAERRVADQESVADMATFAATFRSARIDP